MHYGQAWPKNIHKLNAKLGKHIYEDGTTFPSFSQKFNTNKHKTNTNPSSKEWTLLQLTRHKPIKAIEHNGCDVEVDKPNRRGRQKAEGKQEEAEPHITWRVQVLSGWTSLTSTWQLSDVSLNNLVIISWC